MKILLRNNNCHNGVEIWLFKTGPGGSLNVVKPVNLEVDPEPLNGAFMLPKSTLTIPMRDFEALKQSFVTEAVMAGLMVDPSTERGELLATKKHLADLQKYVDLLLRNTVK